MSDIDTTTELWVLRAKVKAYEESLAALIKGVRGFALTLRSWAVAAGGHTPSAIIAARLLELIGDETPISADGSPVPTEDPMTPSRLAEIRAVVAGATQPGPWTVITNDAAKGNDGHSIVLDANGMWVADCGIAPLDAAFIALARTAIPELLDECERLTKERDEALGDGVLSSRVCDLMNNEQTARRWDYPSAIEETTAEAIAAWLDEKAAILAAEGNSGAETFKSIAAAIRHGYWRKEGA